MKGLKHSKKIKTFTKKLNLTYKRSLSKQKKIVGYNSKKTKNFWKQ
jgi:hypothetical protein